MQGGTGTAGSAELFSSSAAFNLEERTAEYSRRAGQLCATNSARSQTLQGEHLRNSCDDMKTCLFCEGNGPFKRTEHIVPEALGNDDLVLVGEVCDPCNQYFGKEIESFVLGKTPLAFWRTFLGIRKKRGKLPQVDLSQPSRQIGQLGSVHPYHDNFVGFTCNEDCSISVDIDNDQVLRGVLDGTRRGFNFVFTPLVLSMMGRFLCKVGVELVCLTDPTLARGDEFRTARRFARRGGLEEQWPVFHFQSGTIASLKTRTVDEQGPIEEVVCYSYRLVNSGDTYTLLAFTVGTDTWVICLNEPFPTPSICSCFPGQKLTLIWYSPEELRPRPSGQGG